MNYAINFSCANKGEANWEDWPENRQNVTIKDKFFYPKDQLKLEIIHDQHDQMVVCGRYTAMEKFEENKGIGHWVWNRDLGNYEFSVCFLSPKLRS